MKKLLIILFLLFPFTVSAVNEAETVDNKEIRIKINMFDYDVPDDSGNYPGGPNTNTMFNMYSPLKFYAFSNNDSHINMEDFFTGTCEPVQNIVKNTLNPEGYPVMYNNNDLNILFDDSNVPFKSVYSDVNHLFVKRNENSFYFSSDEYYAYLNPDKTFTLYYPTFELIHNSSIEETTPKAGFFPFSRYDPSKTDVSYQNDYTGGYYNHHFGMTIEADLYFPETKKINGEDIIFKFSGDDDIWVFLDDKLILDMGGFHQPSKGVINFTTGQIEYNPGTNFEDSISLNTILDLDALFSNQKESHKLKVFYLERGGVYSNLTIDSNLWFITEETSATEPVPNPTPTPSEEDTNGQSESNSNDVEKEEKNPNTGYNIKNVIITTLVLFGILVVMLFIDYKTKNKME